MLNKHLVTFCPRSCIYIYIIYIYRLLILRLLHYNYWYTDCMHRGQQIRYDCFIFTSMLNINELQAQETHVINY